VTRDEGLFSRDLFGFLRDLARHNDRAWFAEHKERYLDEVQEPAFEFVRAFAPYLARVSPNFVADDRPVGGSVFRIYRDVRFSKDKTPYKTHVGIHFRHKVGKDAHAPVFYLHLQPRESFFAAGVWEPGSDSLRRIREAIVERPDAWRKAAHGRAFTSRYARGGDALRRAPQGFDPDHPLIDDLKLRNHTCSARLDEAAVTSPDFLATYAKLCGGASEYVRFLCTALGQPF
jgi:uncharacterized protein (TIGR02453 family)